MIVMRQPSRKKLQSAVATSDKLEQIYNLYISEAKSLSFISISAAVLAILLLFAGLILWFDGKGPQGWIAGVPSSVILVLSKLLFDRYKDANRRVEDLRSSLEKRDEEEERKISRIMHLLDAYYKVSSKTDHEDQKEAYFHYLFGPIEYNRQLIETYFNIVPFIEDENAKKDILREKFGSLLIAIDG